MTECNTVSPLKKKNRLHGYDCFAAVSFLLIIGGLLYMAQTGIGVPDESFYVTIPHRLMQGDRLILDDWHVSQFSSFMQYLPVKLYYERCGSFDGVILYLRYWYVGLQAVTLAVLYPFLRRFGWKGAVAWTVFGMYVPVIVGTLNYYTLCLCPVVVVCAAMHFSKSLKAPVLILLGVLWAVSVLAEPMTACCFFLYTLFVWIRFFVSKKRGAFLSSYSHFINVRYWAFITLGVFLCAGAFLPFLFRGSDPFSTLKAIPFLFNGYEYDFSVSGGNILTFVTVKQALELYGLFPAVLLLTLTLLAAILKRFRRTVRPLIVAGLAVSLIYAYAHAIYMGLPMNRYDYFLLFYGLPLYLCGPVVYLLLENREKRLWCFWCSGAALSVCIDVSSAVILGVCGSIAAVASLIWLFQLVQECAKDVALLKEDTERKGLKKKLSSLTAAVCAVTALAATLCSEAAFDVYRLHYNIIENGYIANYSKGVCDTLLTRGPQAGIRTTKSVANKYNAILDDLDLLSGNLSGPVLIYDLYPYCYLYLDAPYATYSAWYVDVQEDDRLLLYYDVYPDKKPEYIYVPKYSPYNYRLLPALSAKLARVKSWFPCEVTDGAAGYIVKVLR